MRAFLKEWKKNREEGHGTMLEDWGHSRLTLAEKCNKEASGYSRLTCTNQIQLRKWEKRS